MLKEVFRTTRSPETVARENSEYTSFLSFVDSTLNRFDAEPRFVGGTFTDLINPLTTFDIDVPNRTLHLHNHNKPALRRSDGTIKDIDLISLAPNKLVYRKTRELIKEHEGQLDREHIPHPPLSAEPVNRPGWKRRKQLRQIVSTIDADENGHYFLSYDNISVPISTQSLERWTAILEDQTQLSIFNPFAHWLRYYMRIPSGAKSKDKEIPGKGVFSKVLLLEKLAQEVAAEGKKYDINYAGPDYFGPWVDFIESMRTSPKASIRFKRFVLPLITEFPVFKFLEHNDFAIRTFGGRFTG